jgi:hypothetical protein
MATKPKRQVLRERTAAPRRKRTAADREKLGRDMISRNRTAPPPYEKVLLLIEREDLAFLNDMVAQLKPIRRRASRNELIRLGIALMKDKSPEEIRKLLGGFAS